MADNSDKSRSTLIMGALALGAAAVAAVAAVALVYRSSSSPSASSTERRRRPAKARKQAPSRATAKATAKKRRARQEEEPEEEEEEMAETYGDDDEEEDAIDPADEEIDDMTFQTRLLSKVLKLFKIDVEELWPLRVAIEQFIQENPKAAAQLRGAMPPEVIEMHALTELAVELADAPEAPEPITPEQKLALYCLLADARGEERDSATAAMKEAYRLWRQHPSRAQNPLMEVYMLLNLVRAMRFQPEDESTKYLDQARKLSLKLFPEKSIEVSSIDLERAAMLIASKRVDEAKQLMSSIIQLREELIPASDQTKFPILFYSIVSAVRFFCMEHEDAVACNLLDRFVDRAFETYSDAPVKAAMQLSIVIDVLGQQGPMIPAQRHLVSRLRDEMASRSIEEPGISFKVNLADASSKIVSDELVAALENLNAAMEQIKKMPGNNERLQSMVTGMAYKGMVCVQIGGDINFQEADRCFKQVTPYLQHFEPQLMYAVMAHLYALKKQTAPDEVRHLEALLPEKLKQQIEEQGVRSVYLSMMS